MKCIHCKYLPLEQSMIQLHRECKNLPLDQSMIQLHR